MIRARISAVLSAMLIAQFGVSICLSGVYLLSVIYGFASGYALPTTAIFHLVPATERIIGFEPSLATTLLVVAACGATTSWLARLGVLDRMRIEMTENVLARMARPWGVLLPLCILLIIVNSGGWSGHYTGHPSGSMSVLNLMPWSDAIVYFGSSLDRATLDIWGTVPARRPLAQALRDVTVFLSAYSQPITVLLQTTLIAFAYGSNLTARLRWAAIAVACAAAVVGLNTALSFLYSPVESVSSASFNFTLCGISVGGSWKDCYYQLYADEIAQLQNDQRALTALMLQKAMANIAAHPGVVLLSFTKNILNYVWDLPDLYLTGFRWFRVRWKFVLIIAVSAGLTAAMRKRGARTERIIWTGLFLSTLASAAIIYADD